MHLSYNQGKYKVDCWYLPYSLLAYYRISQVQNKYTQDSIANMFNDKMYFDLKFSYDNKDLLHSIGLNNYTNLVNYLSFGIEKDLCLVCDESDTLYPINIHTSRLYGSTQDNSIILSFDKPDKKKDKYSLIFTNHIFNSEIIKFDFYNKDIKKIPDLLMP